MLWRLLLLACVACGSASPQPCTACLAVAGGYTETAQSNQVSCDNLQLFFNGGSQPLTLTQSGSALTLTGGFSGVLHEDGSAIFGPIPATAQSADGTSPPTPGKLRLAGFFFEQSGALRFEGSYTFIADSSGCQLDARTVFRR